MNRPQAVVFDLDNTLYEYKNCNKVAQNELIGFLIGMTGLKKNKVLKYLLEARDDVKSKIDGGSSHSRLLYIHRFFQKVGIKVEPRIILQAEGLYWNTFFREMKIASGAKEFVSRLRIEGIKTVLITDLTLEIQLKKLIRLDIDRQFDLIISSEEVGEDKISNKPFEVLKKEINDAISSIWFIGDSMYDFPTSQLFESQEFFLSPFINKKMPFKYHKIENYNDMSTILDDLIQQKSSY